MSVKQQREHRDNPESPKGETWKALIGEQVIDALGKPTDLLVVQVRPLWGSRYRVNVFVGPDTASARVANSFFLEADDDGKIVASTPPITRQFAVAAGSDVAKSPAL
jgi:hypothetical protein